MTNLRYVASFEEKLLGSTCDVEVIVDLKTGQSTARIKMRELLRSMPACEFSIESLEELVEAISTASKSAKLLDDPPEGADDHQMNWSSGAASLVAVKPRKKKARFVLNIGRFNHEGELDQINSRQLVDALSRIQTLRKRVSDLAGKTMPR